MLTFMLLVVLGGGLGLLAVSLAESPKPATDGGEGMRAPDPESPLDEAGEDAVDETPEEPLAAHDEPGPTEPDPSLDDDRLAVLAGATPAPRAVAPGPPPVASRRPPDPRRVPLAYTAVEGTYDVVAVAPLWRRLLSLAGLLAIALIIGIAVAAVAAAVFGALAELLNNAVG